MSPAPTLARLPALALALALVSTACAQGSRLIDRNTYADRLRAMWLGQCIANWTGLRTEGIRQHAPFYTDADWGMAPDGIGINFVLNQNPWLADDDTDIEYVYLDALSRNPTWTSFTGQAIASAWIPSVNRFIWVSNAKARALMNRGIVPPMTSMTCANSDALMIDAQLTTEFFGAFCPGMTDQTLQLADLPIRTTATSYAAHASQFHAILYSLATQVDPSLSPAAKMRWLYDEARKYIPDSSKTAEIADFILADFLANPDINDWESTRDKIVIRLQTNAPAYGYQYRAWYESSVNFASTCAGMLYGQGDYKRTVQICTLWGWDSDNSTATLGGLIGLMLGYNQLTAQFPAQVFSDRFNIYRTRDNLTDYLPVDAAAEDTLTLMAQRMLPICERMIVQGGGLVDAPGGVGGKWLLPPPIRGTKAQKLAHSPREQERGRSANNRVRELGGLVSTASSTPYAPPPSGTGVGNTPLFANGVEMNWSGRENSDYESNFFSTLGSGAPASGQVTLTVTYDRLVDVHTIRFIEGNHFDQANARGGHFTTLTPQVRVNGVWITPPGAGGGVASMTPLDPGVPFQIIDIVLASPLQATGIRVTGTAGGLDQFVTCAELDALSAPVAPPAVLKFDLNSDAKIDLLDVAIQQQSPIDLDGNGVIDNRDLLYLLAAVRWHSTTAAKD
ncbi:MAG: ADP-ribosylglycohydrolase family protein [Planctomycetota bacterium]